MMAFRADIDARSLSIWQVGGSACPHAIMSVLQSWTALVQPVVDTLKQSLDNPAIDYRKFVVGAGWAICGLETYIL